jgi:hypothetical protein
VLIHTNYTQTNPLCLVAKHRLGNKLLVYTSCYAATVASLNVKCLVFAVRIVRISVQKRLYGCPIIDVPAVNCREYISLPYDV